MVRGQVTHVEEERKTKKEEKRKRWSIKIHCRE
jgi:hypothetical protein